MTTTVSSRPIPALYTVYVLRSTMRHASLYIGSTTDPPRRLKQHNGLVRGGAARTARASLRPWEMVALVSGFPGAVAALKFEWALTNPHLSLHIPSGSRLTLSHGTKKNGHPRRPPASLRSVVANLHLLLRVPSFARWPLRLHVFAPEVHAAWAKWCAEAEAGAGAGTATPGAGAGGAAWLEVLTDFGPPSAAAQVSEGSSTADAGASAATPAWGIHALPLDYTPLRDYVDKARDVFTFERADECAVCHEGLPLGEGLYVVCPNAACEAAGHLRCWSQHLLSNEAAEVAKTAEQMDTDAKKNDLLLPVKGHCPDCGGPVVWADVMKELTLRLRAPKEVEKLVRAKRRQDKAERLEKATGAIAAGVVPLEDDIGNEGMESQVMLQTSETKELADAIRETKAARARKTTQKSKGKKATKVASITAATATTTPAADNSALIPPPRTRSPEVIIL